MTVKDIATIFKRERVSKLTRRRKGLTDKEKLEVIEERKLRRKEANARYRARHREKLREYNKQYAKDNPVEYTDAKREYNKEYQLKNKDKIKFMQAVSYRRNIDQRKATARKYRDENRKEINAQQREYRRINKEEVNGRNRVNARAAYRRKVLG